MKNNCYKKIWVVAIIILFAITPLISAQLNIPEQYRDTESENSYFVSYAVEYSPDDLLFDTTMGYDVIAIQNCNYLNNPSKPMLPSSLIQIALPIGMAAKRAVVVDEDKIELPGSFDVYPSQPPKRLGDLGGSFVEPDLKIYASSKPYPLKPVEFVNQNDIAGQGIALILVNPLQYIPSENKLILHTSIRFVIEGTGGYVCGNYLPETASESVKDQYERMVKSMVVNPEDVCLNTDPRGASKTSMLDPGVYDYVIITTDGWVNDFQTLADWKTKRGTPAKVVSKQWIYSEYNGTTNQAKIRAFVEDAQSNWGTMYFLLGGDSSIIPYHTKTIDIPGVGTFEIPNDTYYADLGDKWSIDVHVGRASVMNNGTGMSSINNFMNKVFTYEKNPPLTDYAEKILLMGFDLDSSTDGEDLKEFINDSFIPPYMTVTTIYDSDPGTHEQPCKDAINDGQNLINHCDHANYAEMCVGCHNHNQSLNIAEVGILSNGDKQSILYSTGCWAAAFDYFCIAEQFVRNMDGGCVAFIGNSRDGLYQQGNPLPLSGVYDRAFYEQIFNYSHYNLGEAFSLSKNSFIPSTKPYKVIFTELTLLGDPELPIWTQNPKNLTVTHPLTLEVGSSSLTVHVEESGGGNLQDAYVCLWKDDEVYLTNYTNGGGNVSFYLSPSTEGVMYVTVTKHNYIPYEGEVNVIPSPIPIVITNTATNIEETTATIHGYLTSDGGFPTTCWFQWGNNPGEPYTNNESQGIIPNSTEFHKTLTTLTEGQIYYYNTKANNTAGWSNNGGEQKFLTKPQPPTQLTAQTNTSSTIYLTWNKHTSADKTIIERSETPTWQRGQGTEIYNNTGTKHEDYGLQSQHHYYYQAWSYTSEQQLHQYSDNYDQADNETLETSILCGDANGDEVVDVGDVVYIINYLFKGMAAPDPVCIADMQPDGVVDVGDVVYLVNYLFKGDDPPSPNCCEE